jgi:hypothetical protein
MLILTRIASFALRVTSNLEQLRRCSCAIIRIEVFLLVYRFH